MARNTENGNTANVDKVGESSSLCWTTIKLSPTQCSPRAHDSKMPCWNTWYTGQSVSQSGSQWYGYI